MNQRYLIPFWWKGVLLTLLFFVGVGVASAASAEMFFVSPAFDATGRSTLEATQRGVNDALRIFVEDSWWNALNSTERAQANAQMNVILLEFQTVIYPGVRAYYGEEANPGVDNDARIVMLLSDLIDNAGGYFREGDQVLRSFNAISNEHEMVHLNADLLLNPTRFTSFLAHEFQHLIAWNEKNIKQNIREEIWLNEARSEYAAQVLGYDDQWFDSSLRVRARSFFDRPDESLLEWSGADHDYGHVRMFAQYLSEQFGPDMVARTIVSGVGISAVNDAIVKSGGMRTFTEVFKDWMVANYINSIATDPRWGYQRPELRSMRVAPTQEVVIRSVSEGIVSSVVADWGARWHRFSAGGVSAAPFFTFGFRQDSLDDVLEVVYVLERSDGGFEVHDLPLVGGLGTVTVSGFGSTYKAVTVIPMSQTKFSFPVGASALVRGYSITTKRSVTNGGFSIDVVTPSLVTTDGGSTVFIRGSGFTSDARVFVDAVEVSNVVLTGTTVLSFVVPAHGAGLADVRVDLLDGSSATLNAALTYEGGVPDVVTPEEPPVQNNPDENVLLNDILEGDLIRVIGDIDIYIVKFINGKRFKRLILNPEIFNSYGHFNWNSVKEVDPAVLALFVTSTIVRAVDDERVFQLFPNGDEGEKRWLNISSARFGTSGRDWDAIYLINSFERQLYVDGIAITN